MNVIIQAAFKVYTLERALLGWVGDGPQSGRRASPQNFLISSKFDGGSKKAGIFIVGQEPCHKLL